MRIVRQHCLCPSQDILRIYANLVISYADKVLLNLLLAPAINIVIQ